MVTAFAVNVLRLCVWLVLLTALFVPLERFFALRPRTRPRAALWSDLGYYFLNSLIPNIVLSLPLATVAWSAHDLLPYRYVAGVAAMPLWLRMVAALVVGEVGFYWGHRLSHEIPLLWRFHAVHHSAEHLDYLVNTRAHPVDIVFTRLCGLSLLYATALASPVGPNAGTVPLLVIVVGTIWGFFIHANVRWRLGPVEQLVATPAFHHWHHTLNDHRDRNYASMLPWIDRIFGTFYLPRRDWPAEYGTDTRVGDGMGRQLVQPLIPARARREEIATASTHSSA